MNETTQARAPRLRLEPIRHVTVDLLDQDRAGQIHIGNLSTSGIGLLRPPDLVLPEPGTRLAARLAIRDSLTEVGLELVHVTRSIAGCRFLEKLGAIRGLIARHFQSEIAAMDLAEVRASLIRPQPDGEARWFRSGTGCELYLVHSQGRIARFSLTLFGNLIEMSTGGVVTYGRIMEEENDSGDGLKRLADLVRFEPFIPEEIRQSARRFLWNIPGLPEEFRCFLEQRLVLIP